MHTKIVIFYVRNGLKCDFGSTSTIESYSTVMIGPPIVFAMVGDDVMMTGHFVNS